LFQALVAGAACGSVLRDTDKRALAWLEALEPPTIAAPKIRGEGRGFQNFVPNNDLDAVGGDPRNIGKIRTAKTIKPRFFDSTQAFLYVWSFEAGDAEEKHAPTICVIAERLYQLGRGVDMAWAWAEILDGEKIEPRLADHGCALYRPTQGGMGTMLLCPQPGSLESLEIRFVANQQRFRKVDGGKQILFSQPPKPRFVSVAYNSPPHRFSFDLRGTAREAPFAPRSLTRTVKLVEVVRDAVVERLKNALREKEALIERVLIGRNTMDADKAARVRIVPLPSIGHVHADRAIRRVMVEVPPNCPIPAADIAWGFSGLDLRVSEETAELLNLNLPVLSSSQDDAMFFHYGIEDKKGERLWRTVTPAALPQGAARRRIDPSRIHERAERKDGSERTREESMAAGAVLQALRHAHVVTRVETIRVQREPFEGKGARAEAFASGPRFAKERLWHVEITFTDEVSGPLILGDGRYMGLGLMAPVRGLDRITG
jgi:CRISPR-associated protein Csb2